MVKAKVMEKNKKDPVLKKCCYNQYWWRIYKVEDGVSSLQLFFSHCEADSKIALYASKFGANAVIVLKNTDILILLIYIIVILRVRYQKNVR